MEEEYKKGYKQGQIDLIKKWNRWKFGAWFFKRQSKEFDKFLKNYDLDVSNIKVNPS